MESQLTRLEIGHVLARETLVVIVVLVCFDHFSRCVIVRFVSRKFSACA